jgi:alkylation response protein AidB-like acyl-CoA dehydrogenase
MKLYLGHERISAAGVWKCRAHLSRLVGIATRTIRSGRRLIDDPRFAEKLAWLEIRLRALEVILQSVINDPDGARGVMAAVLKLRGTELTQELLLLISEAAGPYALPFHQEVLRAGWGDTEPIGPEFAAPATPAYFFWRKATISGGSSEIMKNLIAQSLF